MTNSRAVWAEWPVLAHCARTALAAVVSVLVAQLFLLPEAYWAAITTMVITQSSLGAALKVSSQRFVGTALGAGVGAFMASRFGPHMLAFGTGVFILGLICAVTHTSRSAYRFGGGYAGDRAVGVADGSGMANSLSSVRRSVHRHWGSPDLGSCLARDGSPTVGENLNSFSCHNVVSSFSDKYGVGHVGPSDGQGCPHEWGTVVLHAALPPRCHENSCAEGTLDCGGPVHRLSHCGLGAIRL
jgi:hypothetical protein